LLRLCGSSFVGAAFSRDTIQPELVEGFRTATPLSLSLSKVFSHCVGWLL